jgi:outer membrane lipoprotein-sorting protein
MRTRTLAPFRLAAAGLALLAAAPVFGQADPNRAGRDAGRSAPAGGSAAEEGPPERDPRADQVLDAAIKAHGGREVIAGRQTVFIKWRIKNFEYPDTPTGTITVWYKRPWKIRQEVAYPHKKETRVFDGDRAWMDDGTGPRLMGSLMARMMQRGILEIDAPLLYTEGSLRYVSIAKDHQGRLTQKLSWRHMGYARDIMVDVATSRVMAVGEFDTPAGAISRLKVFDDYRPVQGVFVPHHHEVYRNSQKYTEADLLDARFNIDVDDTLFQYTGPEPASGGDAPAGGAPGG